MSLAACQVRLIQARENQTLRAERSGGLVRRTLQRLGSPLVGGTDDAVVVIDQAALRLHLADVCFIVISIE